MRSAQREGLTRALAWCPGQSKYENRCLPRLRPPREAEKRNAASNEPRSCNPQTPLIVTYSWNDPRELGFEDFIEEKRNYIPSRSILNRLRRVLSALALLEPRPRPSPAHPDEGSLVPDLRHATVWESVLPMYPLQLYPVPGIQESRTINTVEVSGPTSLTTYHVFLREIRSRRHSTARKDCQAAG